MIRKDVGKVYGKFADDGIAEGFEYLGPSLAGLTAGGSTVIAKTAQSAKTVQGWGLVAYNCVRNQNCRSTAMMEGAVVGEGLLLPAGETGIQGLVVASGVTVANKGLGWVDDAIDYSWQPKLIEGAGSSSLALIMGDTGSSLPKGYSEFRGTLSAADSGGAGLPKDFRRVVAQNGDVHYQGPNGEIYKSVDEVPTAGVSQLNKPSTIVPSLKTDYKTVNNADGTIRHIEGPKGAKYKPTGKYDTDGNPTFRNSHGTEVTLNGGVKNVPATAKDVTISKVDPYTGNWKMPDEAASGAGGQLIDNRLPYRNPNKPGETPDPTHGIVQIKKNGELVEVGVVSGKGSPAYHAFPQNSGLSQSRTHAEISAAAMLNSSDETFARILINNADGPCNGCGNWAIKRAILPGKTLRVEWINEFGVHKIDDFTSKGRKRVQ